MSLQEQLAAQREKMQKKKAEQEVSGEKKEERPVVRPPGAQLSLQEMIDE